GLRVGVGGNNPGFCIRVAAQHSNSRFTRSGEVGVLQTTPHHHGANVRGRKDCSPSTVIVAVADKVVLYTPFSITIRPSLLAIPFTSQRAGPGSSANLCFTVTRTGSCQPTSDETCVTVGCPAGLYVAISPAAEGVELRSSKCRTTDVFEK